MRTPSTHPSNLWWLVVVTALLPFAASARPGGPAGFCGSYPSSAHCTGSQPACNLCHTSTDPAAVAWNDYGIAVASALWGNPSYAYTEESFNDLIGEAVLMAEASPTDADQDGVTNLEEIVMGTLPGNALSYYIEPFAPQGQANPSYAVGSYDNVFAFKRTSIAFCGRSPTFDEVEAFKEAGATEADLHAKLDECLATAYWRNEGLARLADNRIRPINFGTMWAWDYRLWRYANTACTAGDACGDDEPRTARDLLTADYHVRELSPGELTRYDTETPPPVCSDTNPSLSGCGSDQGCTCTFGPAQGTTQCAQSQGGPPGGAGLCRFNDLDQALDPARRAGMLTTAWFHFYNTMFSAMPRTTAAQAMRGYLGLDIAKQQGLQYIATEPADVDNKGVDQGVCKQCHMVLDGATYAFAYYRGIEGGGAASTYSEQRPIVRGLWASPEDARQAYFLDEPVADLVEWADVAAGSDYFKRTHTLTFFKHAVGRPPTPDESAEFEALWRSMDDDNYQTPALLHRIVDAYAFGGL